MKPHVIFVSANDGFVHMSTDDLMNIINKVYEDGFDDGVKSVDVLQPITQPWQSPYYAVKNELKCADDISDQK